MTSYAIETILGLALLSLILGAPIGVTYYCIRHRHES